MLIEIKLPKDELHNIIKQCDSYKDLTKAMRELIPYIQIMGVTSTSLHTIWERHTRKRFITNLEPLLKNAKYFIFKEVQIIKRFKVVGFSYDNNEINVITLDPQEVIPLKEIDMDRSEYWILYQRFHYAFINKNYANKL